MSRNMKSPPWVEVEVLAEEAELGIRLLRVREDEHGTWCCIVEGDQDELPYARRESEARRDYEGRIGYRRASEAFRREEKARRREEKARRALRRAHRKLANLDVGAPPA